MALTFCLASLSSFSGLMALSVTRSLSDERHVNQVAPAGSHTSLPRD